MLTVPQLRAIMPHCPEERAEFFAPYLRSAFVEWGIDTAARVAAFLAQAAHESGELARLRENLNYSAAGLRKTWPRRFPDDATAQRYARQPAKIAERVYGGRLGNGPDGSGDGWRYIGRGIFQLTGRANYSAAGAALGLELLTYPELLEHPQGACRSAGWYWTTRELNRFADFGDFDGLTRAINGGLIGLEDRLRYYERAKMALAA